MNKELFSQNEDTLITNYLFNYVFNGEQLKTYRLAKLKLELIISPECNQNCKYCYIAKFGKDLYPLEERVNQTDTINNLKVLLSFLEDNKILVPGMHLFAGDLFYNNIFFDIIKEIYQYYYNIYQYEKDFFLKVNEPFHIIIPTNFSFIENKNILPKLLKWQKTFSEINIVLQFSASIDGKFLTENREKKDPEKIDEYYKKIFTAIKKLQAGIHPMVSPYGIEEWIKNYLWFYKQLDKYQLYPFPMLLETRDDNWDQDAINHYLNFLDFLIQDRLKHCHNSIQELTYHLFCGDGKYHTLPSLPHYDIIKLHYKKRQDDETGCDLSQVFCVTLNNLKFIPCHRLAYPYFAGGQFIITDNKITKIKAINPSGFIGLHLNSPQIHTKCLECPIYHFCMKGCYGAQYETHGEPLMPNQSVCVLLQEKTKFLLTKYKELGVIDCLFAIKEIHPEIKQEIYKLCELYELI